MLVHGASMFSVKEGAFKGLEKVLLSNDLKVEMSASMEPVKLAEVIVFGERGYEPERLRVETFMF